MTQSEFASCPLIDAVHAFAGLTIPDKHDEDPLLRHLEALAVVGAAICGDGWSREYELPAVLLLGRYVSELSPFRYQYTLDLLASTESHEVAPLFSVVDLVMTQGNVSLWRRRGIRPWGLTRSEWRSLRPLVVMTWALIGMDVENHGCGFHIHPMRKGSHLRYKMLFDVRCRQDDMSWERHGGKRLASPWGDPANQTLPAAASSILHREALSVVRSAGQLTGKYADWASKFEKPGRTAYVAHPAGTGVEPWSFLLAKRATK